jgi:RNA polymerase sigma-70 factor (ECF subfamily)
VEDTITHREFEALFRSVAPELLGYVRRQGAVDVEDVVADVFTTAWRRRADLPPPDLRRAWLFGTARRLLLADARRRHRDRWSRRDGLGAAVGNVEQAETPSGGSDDSGEAVVARAMERLSKADRELLQLSEWERLTPAEIAVALDARPGTIRVRLHRARRALAGDPDIQNLLRDRTGARRTT